MISSVIKSNNTGLSECNECNGITVTNNEGEVQTTHSRGELSAFKICCTAVCVCLLLEKIILSSGAVTKEDFNKLFVDMPSITNHNNYSF